jgi:hypothetical protein
MSVFDSFPKPPCAETLGWTLLDADPATGTIHVAFDAHHGFCNPGGNIQGGFLAAMLDDTLGPTVLVRTRWRGLLRDDRPLRSLPRPRASGPTDRRGPAGTARQDHRVP